MTPSTTKLLSHIPLGLAPLIVTVGEPTVQTHDNKKATCITGSRRFSDNDNNDLESSVHQVEWVYQKTGENKITHLIATNWGSSADNQTTVIRIIIMNDNFSQNPTFVAFKSCNESLNLSTWAMVARQDAFFYDNKHLCARHA